MDGIEIEVGGDDGRKAPIRSGGNDSGLGAVVAVDGDAVAVAVGEATLTGIPAGGCGGPSWPRSPRNRATAPTIARTAVAAAASLPRRPPCRWVKGGQPSTRRRRADTTPVPAAPISAAAPSATSAALLPPEAPP